MSTKNSRSGGKYSGNHTTLIPPAIKLCDIINKCDYVTKISPGFIKSGLRGSGGKVRVKIIIENKAIFLSIRGNTNHQEMYIYGSNKKKISRYIISGIKKLGYLITDSN